VTGHGESATKPDQAIVRFGTTAQADQAAEAQRLVNQTMQLILDRIKATGIPAEHITTVGLSLSPLYADGKYSSSTKAPRVAGYRAHNTVQVQVDDIEQVGGVLDAGVAAGANQIEDVTFQLKNDTPQRQEAFERQWQEHAPRRKRLLRRWACN